MFSSFVGRAANESKDKSPPAEAAAVSHRSARLTALQVSESIPKYLQLHPVHLYLHLRMCCRDVSTNYALQCNALTCHSAEHTHTLSVTPMKQCMHYMSVVFRRISAQRSTWEYNNFGIGTRRSNYEKIKTPDARNARYINILDAIRNLSFYVSRNPNSRWKHKSLERKPDLAT